MQRQSLYQQAVKAFQQRDYQLSATHCQTLTDANANDVDAWVLTGVVQRKLGNVGRAIQAYSKAIALDPNSSSAFNNLGNVLRDIDLYEPAISHYQKAIAVNPAYHEAYNNLAEALLALGRVPEALKYIAVSLEMKPDYVEAHWDLALTLLLLGRYKEGFAEYEWRFIRGDPQPRPYSQPRWNGDSFVGRTLLLYVEQGFGDVLQFLRFLPMVKARGGRVVLEVQAPLIPLLANMTAYVDQLVVKGEAPPAFDIHCPLLSLGQVLAIELTSLPAQVPYVQVPEDRVRAWQEVLPKSGKLRVGLVWAGSHTFQRDRLRSPRLIHMLPVLEERGVDFIGLQMGDGRRDMEQFQLPGNFYDVASGIKDFADTAAIMKNLDFVISSDSAPVHLAGALGVPCWVVLPFVADWRWLLGRNDSPWYPSLTLYRQPKPGDWLSVVTKVCQDLKDTISGSTR